MFAFLARRWLLALVAVVLAIGSAGADDEIARPDGSSGGRSGATKVKVIVVGCGIPDPGARPQGGVATGLAAHIREAGGRSGSIDPKLLRELAEGGSSDWMMRKFRSPDEWLQQVPPKFRPLVKEYFEKLEKTQKGDR